MSITSSQIDRCVIIARKFGVKRLILFGSAVELPETAYDRDLLGCKKLQKRVMSL
ncbi:hypothetical protein KKB84_00960 [bacterium]|nr:hypothetical protein [bacterium]MBU1152536.1 hypothetical protein [bacterium]